MPEKTNLEMQEEKMAPVFGGAKGLGASDKSMLEMTDTNKLIIDAEQSELLIVWDTLYKAITAHTNREPVKKWQTDPQTGQRYEKPVMADDWAWMKDLPHHVKSNQITMGGYSRLQHLEQNAPLLPINEDEGGGGIAGALSKWFRR